MRVVLVGLGACGRQVVRELASWPDLESLAIVPHRSAKKARRHIEAADERIALVRGGLDDHVAGADVVIMATPRVTAASAIAALRGGAHVVAATDEPHDVRDLLALDGEARAVGRAVAIGTTLAPGLSCVLAAFGARRFDRVEEIHVASLGTGGPACARRHHSAFSSVSTDWYDGEWRRRPGGSGRELVWFPEPIGGADCYRARLADPLLLAPAFPGVARVTARLAGTRRDRLTSPLPMLRPPHPEGAVGATTVELRGRRGGAFDSVVVGGVGRPALAAATVSALVARWATAGNLARSGAAGLAELVGEPGRFLREVRGRGIGVTVFEGLSPGTVAASGDADAEQRPSGGRHGRRNGRDQRIFQS